MKKLLLCIAAMTATANASTVSGPKAEPLVRAMKLAGIKSLQAKSVRCDIETDPLGDATCTIDKAKVSGAAAYLLGQALGTAGVVAVTSSPGKLGYVVSGVKCTYDHAAAACSIEAVAQ